ncbi:MAG: hypothetical protein KGM91_07340 [Burkholderiales bacterium]|nr:hypothetical protein [Burkholderiales bacterium]
MRGFSLVFALVALAALLLAAAGMLRSVNTGSLVIGNLGFRQDAVAASSAGAEAAIAYLQANVAGVTLDADHPAAGYYATSLANLDVTGGVTSAAHKMALVDWDADGCADADASSYDTSACLQAAPAKTVNGNTVSWIAMRLCTTSGSYAPGNPCTTPAAAATSNATDRGELTGGGRISSVVTSPYYRIVVRVLGPRHSVSYTETMVHF